MARKNQLKFEEGQITTLEDSLLKCFFPEGNGKILKEIQKRSRYSYERVNTGLRSLEEKSILEKNRVGKTLVYKPCFNSIYLKFAFNHYMMERMIEFSNKHKILYNALNSYFRKILGIVILFGSYSKKKEDRDSDIDLMVVSNSKEETEKIVEELKSKYGFNISLAFVNKMEFSKIKKENPELWRDIKNYGVIFFGKSNYYYEAYKNEQN